MQKRANKPENESKSVLVLMLLMGGCAVPPARACRGRLDDAASLCLAVIDAFKETGAELFIRRPIERKGSRVAIMLVLVIETELGLDGGAVNAIGMQTSPRPLGQLHVLLSAVLVEGE